MSLITPGLSSYSISLYPELKDLDSMMPDNSQVTQPKLTIFSCNFKAGGKAKCRLFFMFPGELVSKG